MIQALTILLSTPAAIVFSLLSVPEVFLNGQAAAIADMLSENLELIKAAIAVLLTPSLW